MLAVSAAALDRLFPPPLDTVVTSREVVDREGLPLRVFPVEDGRWRLAADLENVDPRFIEALLLIEDKRFFKHSGIDTHAIIRAARDNLLSGRIVSGASTITMQTARMLEPRPRNFGSKAIEAIRALQIERRLSKDEILSLYLTLTPYGGNLEGLRAATLAYLGRDADELTDADIALLLALPQSPEARRPDRHPEHAASARKSILLRLSEQGFLTEERARMASDDPLPEGRKAFPARAWHFSERIGRGGGNIVQTTIDMRLQVAAEAQLLSASEPMDENVQAAALIIDIESREVLASVGSIGRDRPGGWLDLTGRVRSPGSTLKPFIFGLAMEEGLITPQTRLVDSASLFGSYAPENFSRTFSGELTVAAALQHSLNVPAVQLLDAVGPARFVGALEAADIAAAIPDMGDDEAGLAVALGGLGVTARDLAALYAALGDGGMARPLVHWRPDGQASSDQPGVRIFSEQTADRILRVLEDSPAPRGRVPARLAQEAPNIAFKTGTSYGFRDAWAVGVSDSHVVVVWVGRPDGGPRPGVTGRDAALPIVFDLFDAIAPSIPQSGARMVTRDRAGPKSFDPETGPEIIFPLDQSTIYQPAQKRPFVLAGRGETDLRWYVNGEALETDREGNTLWTPQGPGFYEVILTDRAGESARASVRVATVLSRPSAE